jgi:hypothetical protein
MRGEYKLKLFENKVDRKTFGPGGKNTQAI